MSVQLVDPTRILSFIQETSSYYPRLRGSAQNLPDRVKNIAWRLWCWSRHSTKGHAQQVAAVKSSNNISAPSSPKESSFPKRSQSAPKLCTIDTPCTPVTSNDWSPCRTKFFIDTDDEEYDSDVWSNVPSTPSTLCSPVTPTHFPKDDINKKPISLLSEMLQSLPSPVKERDQQISSQCSLQRCEHHWHLDQLWSHHTQRSMTN